MKITSKMLAGFGAICAVVAILGGSMVWSLTSVVNNAGLVIGERAPVVNGTNEIKTALNGALAALRGFMLTGQPEQKQLRAHAWEQIAAAGRRSMPCCRVPPMPATRRNGPISNPPSSN